MAFYRMLAGVQLNSFLVVLFTDSVCETQGALGNRNAWLWKEVNQGELLSSSVLLSCFGMNGVSNPPPSCSEMMDLLGNLQTTPAAPHLLISEALLSVCGFQPWGSRVRKTGCYFRLCLEND